MGVAAIRAGKEITLFILNEGRDDIIRTIKSLESSEILINGVTEKYKT